MTIATELVALRAADGMIHVEDVHAWARANDGSALHRALEWDDRAAARKYRFEQIRLMIRIYVVNEDHERQAISLSADRGAGGGYRNLDDVMDVPDLRALALADALDEYQRIKARYDWLRELAEVHEALERVPRPVRRARREPKSDEIRTSL